MANNIFFRLGSSVGSMVGGFKQADSQLEKFNQRATRTGRNYNSLTRMLSGSVRTLIGTAGVSGAFYGIARSLDEVSQKANTFEGEMTKLLSLGDNVKNIAAIKDRVLDISGAFGIARQEVADFEFDLQSGMANLSEQMRGELRKEAIEMTRVFGADLPTSMRVLGKTFQIYGDQVRDVNQIQNKLAITADKGWVTFEELGTLLPDILPAAKAFGFTLDDVLGGLITATQVGGKSEKTFTGLRNVFLRLSNAEKEGVKLTGDFAHQMRQLADVDPEKLKTIFGDEAISIISAISQKYKELGDNIKEVRDVQGDLANEKLLARLKDEAFLLSEINKAAKQGGENATLRGGGSVEAQRSTTQFELAKRGYKEQAPGYLQFMATPAAMAETVGSAIQQRVLNPVRDFVGMKRVDRFAASPYFREGYQATFNDLSDAGQHEQARAMQLSQGAVNVGRNPYTQRPTGQEDAVRFIEALERNTQATEANTQAAGGGGGVVADARGVTFEPPRAGRVAVRNGGQ